MNGTRRIVALAAALAAILAAGCARPPDEAWLRFLGFRPAGATSGLTVVTGQLLDETTESVDAAFENATVTVGRSDGGTGILITGARVEYRLQGATPPAYEYPLTLYLPAPAKAGEATSGTVADLPIVPASLKLWIVDSGVQRRPEVRLTANVTFFAVTDDNNRLEVGGSVLIVLADSGGTGGTPTVSVRATDPTAVDTTGDNGEFTVSRTGSTTAAVTVAYSVGGTAVANTDYTALSGSVVIPSGSATATIPVSVTTDTTTEGDETVIITLSAGSGYALGSPKTATVTITD